MSDYQRRRAPATEEGWYALHDLRRVDWDAWRAAPERERERALEEGVEFLEAHERLDDVDGDAGDSAVFGVVGHKADLLVLHLRPTTSALDRAERAFEQSAFAEFTERASSYVSVTEVSGYVTEELGEGLENIESEGTRNYMKQRLYPSIPDAEHVCFYPMDKRRGPEDNWYDTPFDERADLMAGHGDVGREYAGDVTQIITGSLGFDDHEWGVTLFADDATDIKHLLYDMRFDPSSSRFAEFGPFYFGRRFPPADLPAFMAGERVPTDGDATTDPHGEAESPHRDASDGHPHGSDDAGTETAEAAAQTADEEESSGRPPVAEGEPPHDAATAEELERELRRVGVDPDDHRDAGHAVVVYSDEDAEALVEEVDGLRGNFDHYDTHVATHVRADSGRSAVVSLWANERAANTASGFLFDLSGVEEGVGGPLEIEGEAGSASDGERAGPRAGGGSTDEVGDVQGTDEADDIRGELADLDVYAGQPHGEDVYAMVVYSEADADELFEAAADLRGRFDHYDTHVRTSVYASDGRRAVVSLWDTREAAETAGGYLADLPGVVSRAGEGDGFGTMGMFYTVKPDHRGEFVERFDTVGDLLAEMDGHEATDLLVNHENDDDMFIASRWDSKEDAMAFFRSEDFRDTVAWGREVLADRPRHVFLA